VKVVCQGRRRRKKKEERGRRKEDVMKERVENRGRREGPFYSQRWPPQQIL
jgi:hypothetical protein